MCLSVLHDTGFPMYASNEWLHFPEAKKKEKKSWFQAYKWLRLIKSKISSVWVMPNLISAAAWKCYPHRSSLGSQRCSVLQGFAVWLTGIAEVISSRQGKSSRKHYHMEKTGGGGDSLHFFFSFFPLEMSASRILRALGWRVTEKHFFLLKSSCSGTAFVPSLAWVRAVSAWPGMMFVIRNMEASCQT